MRLDKIKFKKKIASIIIISLLLSTFNVSTFAGQFVAYNGGVAFVDDANHAIINQWRWIDDNHDGIAECYRFGKDALLQINATLPDGKMTNEYGQWVLDGLVQRVYLSSMLPLNSNFYQYNLKNDKTATSSRVNASGKNLESIQEEKSKNKKQYFLQPNIKETEALPVGQYLGKKINMPIAEKISGQTINGIINEETITYDESGVKRVAGKSMINNVTASKNFTKEVENVKIFGGEVWDKCMCFSGHNSYAKFDLKDNNYMYFEVAHQAHGSSTADTECYLEYYINGELIDIFDGFVDSVPIEIEDWYDSTEHNIELRWKVPSGSQGRKLYIKNAVFRKLRDDD